MLATATPGIGAIKTDKRRISLLIKQSNSEINFLVIYPKFVL